MLHIVTVLSVLAAIATASKPRPASKLAGQAPGLCAAFFEDTKSALQIPVCPSTLLGSDLHYVCGDYASTDAEQVCASLGWRVAMLEDGVNTAGAYAIMAECAGNDGDQQAWIGGYNGMAAEPCMIAFQSAAGNYTGAYSNLGIQYCQTGRANIICQDIPIITVTFTAPAETVTTGGGASIITATASTTKTQTVTACPTQSHQHHHWCPCSSSSSSWTSESCDCHCNCSWNCKAGDKSCKQCPAAAKGFIHKGAQPADKRRPRHDSSSCHRQPPNCNDLCDHNECSTCTKLCDVSAGNIRMLQKLIAPEDAAAECAKFGWSLFDMLSGQEADVKYVMEGCQPSGVSGAWMNSFDGVTASCVFAEINNGRVNAQYPIGGQFCDGGYYVLCQTGCPAPVGEGADVGIITATAVTTTPTTTVFTPTTTVVVTATVTNTTTTIVFKSNK